MEPRRFREKPVGVESSELVQGDRQKAYGDPLVNLRSIAAKWTETLQGKLQPGQTIQMRDVAIMMIDLKTCRDANGVSGRDNEVDICGYAHLMQFEREARLTN